MKKISILLFLMISFASVKAAGLTTVTFTHDGKYIITSGSDYLLKIWDSETKRLLKTIELEKYFNVSCVSMSPDDKFMAVTTDRNLFIVSVPEGEVTKSLKEKNDFSLDCSVTYMPDGKNIISASKDGVVKIWNLDHDKVEKKIKTKIEYPKLALSGDGKILACGGKGKIIKLFDVVSGDEIGKFKISDYQLNEVFSISFSSDSKYVAASGGDCDLTIYNVGTKTIEKTIDKSRFAKSVLFSLDNKFIYYANGSKVCLFDLATGVSTETKMDQGTGVNGYEVTESNDITAMAFGVDGKFLLTGSRYNTAMVWDVSTEKDFFTIIYSNDRPKTREEIENGQTVVNPDGCVKCGGEGILGFCMSCRGTGKVAGVGGINNKQCSLCKNGRKICFTCGGSGKK